MNNSTANERLIYPDILKGILIVLVVAGHVIGLHYKTNMEDYWNNPIITFIYSFHMPLFLAISGFFMGFGRQLSFIDFLKKKSKRLLYPIITIAIACVCLDLLFGCVTPNGMSSIKRLYSYFTLYWFLDCLFIMMVVVSLTESVGGAKIRILVLLLIIVSILLYDYLPRYIFKDLQVVRQLPIFYAACYLGRNSSFINCILKHKYSIFFVATAFWMIIVVVSGLNLLKYSCLMRVLIGLCSSVSAALFIYFMRDLLPQKLCNWLGRNSFGIYILHVPVFKLLPQIENWIIIALCGFLLLVLSSIITDFCRKTFLKEFILGE